MNKNYKKLNNKLFSYNLIFVYYGLTLKKRFKGRLVGLFQHCVRRLIVLLPQMSSYIHLERRHAPHRRERPLLAKEGTITKEFS